MQYQQQQQQKKKKKCSRRQSISGLQPPRLILPDRKRDGWSKLSHQTAVYRAGGSQEEERGGAGGKGEGRGEVREAAGRWSEAGSLIKVGITWRHLQVRPRRQSVMS